MPNDTLRANAQAMPIDRRTALGAIAAAGAMLAVPHVAKAEGADAELFAAARRVKALEADYRDTEDAYEAARERMVEPPFPRSLIVRKEDTLLFSRLRTVPNEPFSILDIRYVEGTRKTMVKLFDLIDWRDVQEPRRGAKEMLSRCVEVESDFAKYEKAQEEARAAAGLPALDERLALLDRELVKAWRALAFTPAQTVEGVLAKLDAVSATIAASVLDLDNFPEICEAVDVARMAAADLAALNKPTEA